MDSITKKIQKKDIKDFKSLELYKFLGEISELAPEAERKGNPDLVDYANGKANKIQQIIDNRSFEKSKELKNWKKFPKIR